MHALLNDLTQGSKRRKREIEAGLRSKGDYSQERKRFPQPGDLEQPVESEQSALLSAEQPGSICTPEVRAECNP
jgi:hypothetical protein